MTPPSLRSTPITHGVTMRQGDCPVPWPAMTRPRKPSGNYWITESRRLPVLGAGRALAASLQVSRAGYWRFLIRVSSGHGGEPGRYLTDVDPEAVPVGGIDGDRQLNPVAVLVEADPVNLEHGDSSVTWELEEQRLVLLRRPHRDRVAIAGPREVTLPGEVGEGSLTDIHWHDEPRRTALHQTHGVEGGLQRPGGVIDEPLLVPAHHLRAWLEPQGLNYYLLGFLDLHTGLGAVRPAAGRRHLSDVDAVFPAAIGALVGADQVARKRRDERLHLLDDEGSLSGTGLDQA